MIKKFNRWFSPGGRECRIHLYLPDNYDQTDERYPTLYFFDGQNLFCDDDASYGTCLGLKDFLDRWHKKLIVVGIESSKDGFTRAREYIPYRLMSVRYGSIHGRADATLNWLVHELKSYIDKKYRTCCFRETTSIGGCGIGGLAALYGVLRYNQYFSKAAILSPSMMLGKDHFIRELDEHDYSTDTRIYLSWGTNECNPEMTSLLSQSAFEVEKKALEKGIKTYIHSQQDGDHSEASWREQTETWMRFLWE